MADNTEDLKVSMSIVFDCTLYLFCIHLFLGKEIPTKILGIFKECLCLLEKNPEVSSQENGDQKIRISPFDSIVNLTLSLHQMKILGKH